VQASDHYGDELAADRACNCCTRGLCTTSTPTPAGTTSYGHSGETQHETSWAQFTVKGLECNISTATAPHLLSTAVRGSPASSQRRSERGGKRIRGGCSLDRFQCHYMPVLCGRDPVATRSIVLLRRIMRIKSRSVPFSNYY
jgi:hypothetical protein